jgi:hypothetical protein
MHTSIRFRRIPKQQAFVAESGRQAFRPRASGRALSPVKHVRERGGHVPLEGMRGRILEVSCDVSTSRAGRQPAAGTTIAERATSS